jgi:aspartyl-tRNA(Asn)/glutamyl-tRNA(Gln) amidotransferase subunit B
VARVRQAMPELPAAMAERFQRDDGLPAYDAAMMTQSLPFARYYEALRDACLALPGGAREAPAWAKLAANWLMGEVAKRLNAQGLSIETCPVPATVLAALIGRVADGTVSNSGARQVFEALWTAGDAGPQEGAAPAGARVDRLIEQMGLRQMSDAGALEALVDQVLAAHPKSVEEFKAGKDKAFNALVGQVMKASQGKANPAQGGEILRRRLAQP